MITSTRAVRGLVVAAVLASGGIGWAQPGRGFGGPPGGFSGGPPGGGPSWGGRSRGFGEPDSLLGNMRREDLTGALNLSEPQQERLNALNEELSTARRDFFSTLRDQPRDPNQSEEDRREQFRKKMQDMSRPYEDRAVKVLNDQQKATWEIKKTEYLKEAADREAGRESGGSSTRGSSPATPAAPPKNKFAFVPQEAPEGANVVASFDAAGAVRQGGAGNDTPNDTLMSFNFRYAPWADVLKFFAEKAGLTLDLTDVPPGTFNYFDDHRYTITEALDVLNGYLLPKGYVLVRRDRFLACLNIEDGIPPNLVPTITPSELPHRGKNELVSLIIPVHGLEASKIDGELKVLLGPQGTIAPLRNTNSLVVTDVGFNVRRIYELLKDPVDKDSDHDFKSIPLKYVAAADAERKVRQLFGLNSVTALSTTPEPSRFSGFGSPWGGFGGGPPGFDRYGGGDSRYSSRDGGSDRGDRERSSSSSSRSSSSSSQQSPYMGKIQVTADTRTNHLMVTASSQLLRVVEDVVKSLDTEFDAEGNRIVRSESPVVLKVYSLGGGDATQIANTLSMMMPQLLIIPDPKSSRLHIQATTEEHREVAKLVEQFTGDSTNSVAVIPLVRLDPVAATNSLRNLFSAEGTRAPSIEADSQGRRLMVRGSPDQVAQVRTLLAQLGEPGENATKDTGHRGLVRTLNTPNHDVEELLPLLKQAWSNSSKSPIRIVIPSQVSPIKDRRIPSLNSESPYDTPQPSTESPRQRIPTTDATEIEPTNTAANGRVLVHPVDELGAVIFSGPEQALPSADALPQVRSRPFVTRSATSAARVPATPISAQRALPARNAVETRRPIRNDVAVANTFAEADFNAFVESFCDPADAEVATEAAEKPADAAQPDSPIGLSVVGGQLIVSGTDEAVLDQFESLVEKIVAAMPVRTRYTVFPLLSADATETAQMLERLFPQSTVTASTSSSDGLLGSFSSGISSFGRGMMSATGLNNYTLGGQNLRIITDLRSNSLWIAGPSDKIAEVESVLQVLDARELPQSLRDRMPRTIPVEYADIDEVSDWIESVYKDAINPEQQNAAGRGGFNPLAMLMGGGGGGGAGGASRPKGPELTLGVDRRTNHLIVSCNDTLFRQIEDLVKTMDQKARDTRQTVRVVPLATADPSLVSATLASLIPKVSVSATRGPRKSQPGMEDNNNNNSNSSSRSSSSRSNSGDADMMRRIIEQRMQQGGGDSGRGSSSGSSGRGSSSGFRGGSPGGSGFGNPGGFSGRGGR